MLLYGPWYNVYLSYPSNKVVSSLRVEEYLKVSF